MVEKDSGKRPVPLLVLYITLSFACFENVTTCALRCVHLREIQRYRHGNKKRLFLPGMQQE